ncbi:glutamate receptor ionotropic, kainate 1-like [Pollicipes pollicipes]|uniref:glutamate receptor ionotropic, kainate 1-like n=1 Tax=Pollicipes pollicipes TaxID=41117 RepID=UPI0018855F01|nr:glutamate receptor ionotropic, kainate 1-like [Pollicipes pollicipes]
MSGAVCCRVAAVVALLPLLAALPSRVRIGAIFTEDRRGGHVEMAFKYAVLKVNSDTLLLPNITLEYDIQYAYRDDSFHAAKKACGQLQGGVFGLFGPSDTLLGAHVQSICDSLDVPHVETRLDVDPRRRQFSVNLHPSYQDLTRAFRDLMGFLNWTRVAVVYEEDAGLVKLQDLVKAPPDLEMEVYIRQAGPSHYRHVLREIKDKGIFNLVVDTNPENIQLFLRSLLQLQMNDDRYHYLFTCFVSSS